MKKFQIYYTIQKPNKKPITKYLLVDGANESHAYNIGKNKLSEMWQGKGYLLTIGNISLWQGFYI